ncbi:MAG: hypothetical protein AAF465_01485 [Pseudomonadota bacterium]
MENSENSVDDIGILVVHGIGIQKAGESLEAAGNAIIRCLANYGVDVSLLTSKPKGTTDEPPSLDIAVLGKHWAFAECHWAESFLEPKYAQLTNWSLMALPSVAVRHFGRFIRRALKRPTLGQKIVSAIPATLAYLAMAAALPFICLSLMVVNLLSFLPIIGPVARGLRNILIRIAGDALVFTDNPVQEAAILGVFRERLLWLAERVSGPIVVLAHSQGAAVSRLGLYQWDEPALRKRLHLYTYGSGLVKLTHVRGGAHASWWYPWLATLATGFIATGATLLWTTTNLASLLVCALGFALLVIALRAHSEDSRLESYLDPSQMFTDNPQQSFRWTDTYASHDPVPGGAMFDRKIDYLASFEVTNRRSTVFDHTSYWLNRDEFVTRVTNTLLREARYPGLQNNDVLDEMDQANVRASLRRRFRASVKSILRWFVVIATAVSIYLSQVTPNALAAHTRAVLQRGIDAVPYGWAERASAFWLNLSGSALAALSLLAVGLLGYGLLALGWRQWEKADSEVVYSRSNYTHGGYLALLFTGCCILFDRLLAFAGLPQPILIDPISIAATIVIAVALFVDAWWPARPPVEEWIRQSADETQWRWDDGFNRAWLFALASVVTLRWLHTTSAIASIDNVLLTHFVELAVLIVVAFVIRGLVRTLLRKSARYHLARKR